MQTSNKEIKLIVVGDGAVGKTCFLLSYAQDKFPIEYVPTVFENSIVNLTINGEQYTVMLWDTAGQECYSQVRTVSYTGSDIFMICFSVVDPVSFENATKKWIQEIEPYNKNGVILFVGLKTDLRDYDNPSNITTQVADITLRKLGYNYRETSALTQDGLKEVFTFALTQLIEKRSLIKEPQKVKKSRCILI